ncbi:hypothetical protein ABT008_00800 [Micromonospora sp. NPDC002389]|uniref:hypothetical protein n=1 Tax=Micromonospora sp. NPDC002389 TaxID=3154272 RepID=UPI0033237E43
MTRHLPADRGHDGQLRAGDLLRVTRRASVQFHRSIMFRVIRELDWTTYDGWVWLDGYQLDIQGNALTRRSIFVQRAGLTLVRAATRPTPARTAPAPTRGVRRQPPAPATHW